jgi:hypothetical protein
LSREQFIWGLSNGVNVLAVAAAFWIGLAAWVLGTSVLVIAAIPIMSFCSVLVWKGIQLRRQTLGLSRANLRSAPKGSSIRRIAIGFNIVGAAQAISTGLVGFICWQLHRADLLWPLIGLVISLHFLPLARIFSVRPYYVLGVLGTVISLISLLGFAGSARTVAVGIGLGLLIAGCAVYLVVNAVSLADEALRTKPSPL